MQMQREENFSLSLQVYAAPSEIKAVPYTENKPNVIGLGNPATCYGLVSILSFT